jgi:hypothetical protein
MKPFSEEDEKGDSRVRCTKLFSEEELKGEKGDSRVRGAKALSEEGLRGQKGDSRVRVSGEGA